MYIAILNLEKVILSITLFPPRFVLVFVLRIVFFLFFLFELVSLAIFLISYFAGYGEYGPRMIVRSIKRIKRSEEVTVAYTDLLQPKVRR